MTCRDALGRPQFGNNAWLDGVPCRTGAGSLPHGCLIEHPQEGLILVDAGISWRQTYEHGTYYKGKT